MAEKLYQLHHLNCYEVFFNNLNPSCLNFATLIPSSHLWNELSPFNPSAAIPFVLSTLLFCSSK